MADRHAAWAVAPNGLTGHVIFSEPVLPEANIANAYEIMSRPLIAPLASALCLALSACQTAPESPPLPSPDTASAAAAVPASSSEPIRGVGQAPHLAGQSHWAIGQCTTNGTVKVCN
ncbi:putative lipoprotein [Burkholderia lata]|uniref:Putative lipoprotein n=2 Tax=Burkholderia lata (strain ATCC 17760 / DSM 23089 / LMG 22485 / NCIMB 9086 / R18194 / 383) TaxID=482957 RepID=A0A6P2GXV7_BURL3|nr:putative lipoprotein [Burkholderia lata]